MIATGKSTDHSSLMIGGKADYRETDAGKQVEVMRILAGLF